MADNFKEAVKKPSEALDSEGSDLDLLVELLPDTTLMDIARKQNMLLNLTGVTVDVLTPNALPESFRDQVLSEALPV